MSDQLKSLLDLQNVDKDLHLMRDLKLKRPLELEMEKEKLAGARGEITIIEENIKSIRMECDREELLMKQNLAEIEKFKIALNGAKNNQEYQVLRDQIERITEKNSVTEEEVLQKLSSIDDILKEKKKAEDQVKMFQEDLAEKQREMDLFINEVNEKLKTLEDQRAERIQKISGDDLELYEKVLKRYEDSALALVESKICHGCYMSVTTQSISLLMMGQDLIQCKNCLRILYLPDMVA